ncbi:hypothetical protein C8E00_101469 [Chromohalobacter marismortui]|uniref:Uncharacterized protein n=1 Tax=Chromohalobacter marismortui TaxID=42055 RepID=A0A4R7NVG9_9GAMM|nr:hypothetical protein C8E00_101469 [Chromohalobacter marismortui]
MGASEKKVALDAFKRELSGHFDVSPGTSE